VPGWGSSSWSSSNKPAGRSRSIGLFLRLAGTLGRRPSELVAGVDWVPFEIVEGEGAFEVIEDEGLLDEIAALKEARPGGRPDAG
jgi:hypothetical protein